MGFAASGGSFDKYMNCHITPENGLIIDVLSALWLYYDIFDLKCENGFIIMEPWLPAVETDICNTLEICVLEENNCGSYGFQTRLHNVSELL